MNSFEEFGLSSQLLEAIKKQNISIPTEIQAKSIKEIVAGKDVIGESATGSGKTLAFGCGIVERVKGHGLQALVLTPTRELAEQVKRMLSQLSRELHIISVYGGVSINPQIHDIQKANVVVATPGRLLDHMERRTINLSKIKILVLDEADRMLDMGFIEDVEKIIQVCPRDRQTMLFSATISPEIKTLAHRYLNNPLRVSARNQVDPSKLKQEYYDVQRNMKMSLLVHLLKKEQKGLVMVFCNTRRTTDFVAKNLKANGVDAVAIHGGFSQNKRDKSMSLFSAGRMEVLVCTDVAARGLHIEDVSHIYNYEVPKDPTDYIHRIGRTARAGKEGKVVNLICDLDYENFSKIYSQYRMFNITKLDRPQTERVNLVMDESRGGRHHEGRGSYGVRRNDFHRRRR
jgi:ATP-dependent RNA helicase DeaD